MSEQSTDKNKATDKPIEKQTSESDDIVKSRPSRWVVLIVVFLIVSSTGLPAVWFLMKPQYVTKGAIRISPIKERIIFSDADSERPMPNYENFKNTEAASFNGDDILNKAADQLVHENITILNGSGDLVGRLRAALDKSDITIVPAKNSELIILEMTTEGSQQAERIINAFIDAYINKDRAQMRTSSDERTKLLEEQRDVYRKQMAQQQELIKQLTVEYGTQELTAHQEMMLQEIERLQSEWVDNSITKISLEAQIAMIKESSEQQVDPFIILERQIIVLNSNPEIETLNTNIREFELLVMEGEESLSENQPELKRRKRILEAYKQKLENKRNELIDFAKTSLEMEQKYEHKRKLADLENQLSQTILFEEKIREKLQSQDAQTINIGRKQFVIDDESEKLARTKQLYYLVTQSLEEIRVESQRPGRIEIARYASSVPKKDIKLISLIAVPILGLVLGLAAIPFTYRKKKK